MGELRELKTLNWNYVHTGGGAHETPVYIDPDEVASIEPYVPHPGVEFPDNPRADAARRRHWSIITLKHGHKIFVAMRTDLVHESLQTAATPSPTPVEVRSHHCGVCNGVRHFQNEGRCGECGSTRSAQKLCPKCGAQDTIWIRPHPIAGSVFCCARCKTDIPDTAFS